MIAMMMPLKTTSTPSITLTNSQKTWPVPIVNSTSLPTLLFLS